MKLDAKRLVTCLLVTAVAAAFMFSESAALESRGTDRADAVMAAEVAPAE